MPGRAETLPMWLSKPLYEALPYYYMVAGLLVLGISAYVDYGIWPLLGLIVGLSSLIAGLVVWLRRRDYRRTRNQAFELDAD
jgi:hypothetical protein